MCAMKKFVQIAVGGLIALILITAFNAGAGEGQAVNPTLDGAWIIAVPTPGGVVTGQWTATRLDADGTRYMAEVRGVKSATTVFGMFPKAVVQTNHVGQTVRTEGDAYETTVVGYGVASPASPEALGEMVYISVIHSVVTLTGDDAAEGEGMHAFYLPFADGDGDGLPDEGQEPVICLPYTLTAARVPLLAPCEPSLGYPTVGSGSSTGVSETEFAGTATLVIGGRVNETTLTVTVGDIVVDDNGTQHVQASHTFTFADGTSFTTTDEETAVPTETPGLYSLTATLLVTKGDYGGRLQAIGTMDFAAVPPQAKFELYGSLYPVEGQ